jgi:thiamine biosynthesis lipoprotein
MKSVTTELARRCLAILCAGMGLLSGGCGASAPAKVTWISMGTFASVSVPGQDEGRLTSVSGQVRAVFEEVEAQASLHKSNSVLTRICAAAGKEAVPVPDLTHEVIAASLRYAELSGGRFDPTVAPIVRRWGFSGGRTPTNLPPREEIAAMMSLIGYRQVVLQNKAVFLPMQGMMLDLGGIAKGFAVDVAYRQLESAAVQNALIDLGGNMRCLGSPRPRLAGASNPWRIGVRNPFDREKIVGIVRLPPGMAVASSGNYERFVEIDGVRYTHIIDPRTGMPVKGMAGTTVLCDTATETDALSTALFVAGVEDAKALLEKFPACRALIVPDERPIRLIVTPGFKALFDPLPEFAANVQDL